jgi:hypothetical protein
MTEQRSAEEIGHEKRRKLGKKQGKEGWFTYAIQYSKRLPIHLYAAIGTKDFLGGGQLGLIPRARRLRGRRRNKFSPIIALLEADGSLGRRLSRRRFSRWGFSRWGLSRWGLSRWGLSRWGLSGWGLSGTGHGERLSILWK